MSKHAQAIRRATLGFVPWGGNRIAPEITMDYQDLCPFLVWEAPAYPVDDYAIHRNKNGEGWQEEAVAEGDATSWKDANVDVEEGEDVYEYRIEPRVSDGDIPYSNVVETYGQDRNF